MRIIITDLPKLLNEIVANIARKEPDIDLITVTCGADLAQAVHDSDADVVVTAAREDSGPLVAILRANPRLRVIAVGERGRTGWLWELRPHKESLGELTVARLIHALRHTGSAAVIGPSERN